MATKYHRTKLAATDQVKLIIPGKKDEGPQVVRGRIVEVGQGGSISASATINGKDVKFPAVDHASEAEKGKVSWHAFHPTEKLDASQPDILSLEFIDHAHTPGLGQ